MPEKDEIRPNITEKINTNFILPVTISAVVAGMTRYVKARRAPAI